MTSQGEPVEQTEALAAQAAKFVDVFALPAYDRVQLSNAHALHTAQADPVVFAGFDLRLSRAAATLGPAALG